MQGSAASPAFEPKVGGHPLAPHEGSGRGRRGRLRRREKIQRLRLRSCAWFLEQREQALRQQQQHQ